MTREQEMVTNTIRDYMTGEWDRRNRGSTRTYEIKEERISEELEDRSINISMTRGLEGDEGTMAEVFCRDTIQVFVGPEGGCWCWCESRTSRVKGYIKYTDNWMGVVHRSMEEFR